MQNASHPRGRERGFSGLGDPPPGGAPARNSGGTKVQAFDPSAVRWCALGAIQKIYPKWQWEDKMDLLLRALSVSESGLASLTTADKMCCLMEWNDDSGCSFTEVREILLAADL